DMGFDCGRVDGILGPRTEQALAEFQRNMGLVSDAVCGPATVAALDRLGTSGSTSPTVATVRERENHRRGPRSLVGRRIAVGETGGLDALARAIVGALATAGGEVVLLQHPDGSEQAARANAFAVDAFVGVALADDRAAPCTTAYYRSPGGWESAEGRRLAEAVQATVPPVLHATDGGIRGMALPVLRETRMPAVLADIGPPAVVVERSAELAGAFTAALRAWVED
ncbi:MAG TPA: peptidoglycan-binding protein, partial [Acidimicrobiales bacterium]|nr:peptidoglycan-binding protein [Acidimicrobiales bacterium]